MTPEAAVGHVAEIIAARAEFTEDVTYRAMAETGISDPIADRAYRFSQIAWGWVILDGLGVQYSPDYLCFNGAGDVVESGLLAEQPPFIAAMSLGGDGSLWEWSPFSPGSFTHWDTKIASSMTTAGILPTARRTFSGSLPASPSSSGFQPDP